MNADQNLSITIPERLSSSINKDALSAIQAPSLDNDHRQQLLERCAKLLKDNDATLVAHYYTDADLQMLAEETGGIVSDSLEMARFGSAHPASTLVVAGVRFMGETAKILSPEKRILMPDLEANCSLDLGCPSKEFSDFCDQHPDRTVVVYANTSAEVKARADWMVTSGIALNIVKHLHTKGEKILWAPDKHLGNYVQTQTGADMLMWQGSCVVHEAFKAQALKDMIAANPDAKVLVHPESPQAVWELADLVGSTTALIKAVTEMDAQKFIVATDNGIFYKMRQFAPTKTLLEAPTYGEGATCVSCAHCPWMGMNGLENLAYALEQGKNEIHVDEHIRVKALESVGRMVAFAEANNIGQLAKNA